MAANPLPFQYLVMHAACKNHPGVLAVQAGHAAGEAIRSAPIPTTTTICALEAETSDALVAASEALTRAEIPHVLIREPDEPWSGAATALATDILNPIQRALAKVELRAFKLLK